MIIPAVSIGPNWMNFERALALMAGRVEEMIRLSVRSVVESDSQLAEETILKDRLVNRDELEIDEMCLVLLARRQPMGTDLRFITREHEDGNRFGARW